MGLSPVGRRPEPLDPEEGLELVPRREDRERGQERQDQQRHPEADVRAASLAAALRPGAPSRPLAAVGVLDRERIE